MKEFAAKRKYNALRKRFFMDGQGFPVPLSKKLRWIWVPAGSPFMGATQFDIDDEPESIELNVGLLHWPAVLENVLLHEMTHIRLGPDVACPSLSRRKVCSPRWRAETVRLATLGAKLL